VETTSLFTALPWVTRPIVYSKDRQARNRENTGTPKLFVNDCENLKIFVIVYWSATDGWAASGDFRSPNWIYVQCWGVLHIYTV